LISKKRDEEEEEEEESEKTHTFHCNENALWMMVIMCGLIEWINARRDLLRDEISGLKSIERERERE
jgi:hypothetical protein